MIYLIIFVAVSWLLQGALGLIQVRNFNRRYAELRRLGRVAIGKKTGKFMAGTVVMFAINAEALIVKAVQMQGVTVFSRVRSLEGFEGKYLMKLTEGELGRVNRLTRFAIKDALNSYDIITKGGELKIKKPLLERLFPGKK